MQQAAAARPASDDEDEASLHSGDIDSGAESDGYGDAGLSWEAVLASVQQPGTDAAAAAAAPAADAAAGAAAGGGASAAPAAQEAHEAAAAPQPPGTQTAQEAGAVPQRQAEAQERQAQAVEQLRSRQLFVCWSCSPLSVAERVCIQ